MAIDKKKLDKNFLIHKILQHHHGEYPPMVNERLAYLKRDKISAPHFYITDSTCSKANGSEDLINFLCDYKKHQKPDIEIIKTGCFGLCSEEPLLGIQTPGNATVFFTKVKPDQVLDYYQQISNKIILTENVLGQVENALSQPYESVPFINDLLFFSKQNRIVLKNSGLISPLSIEDYISNSGFKAFVDTITNRTPEETNEIIQQSGLRGRGGNGFPTGKKWMNVFNQKSDQRYIICNADESDPGHYISRVIMESNPFNIIEGICIAAYCCGASKAIIYTRSRYKHAIQLLENALAQATNYGLLGLNIFNSGFNFEIKLFKGAGAFVCGEETALIKSIEGKRGMPSPKPPYPSEKGLHNKPTAII